MTEVEFGVLIDVARLLTVLGIFAIMWWGLKQ